MLQKQVRRRLFFSCRSSPTLLLGQRGALRTQQGGGRPWGWRPGQIPTPRGTSQPPMTLTLAFGGKTLWQPCPAVCFPLGPRTGDVPHLGPVPSGPPSSGLGQVPHGGDSQHGLLPHRGAQVVSGLLLQQHLGSTAGWDGLGRGSLLHPARACGAGRAWVPPSWHPLPTQHPVVPDPMAGRAVPITEPQAGQRTCKRHWVQVPAPAEPPSWLWSISKDGDLEQHSSALPCPAEPSPAPRAVPLPLPLPLPRLTGHPLTSMASTTSSWQK